MEEALSVLNEEELLGCRFSKVSTAPFLFFLLSLPTVQVEACVTASVLDVQDRGLCRQNGVLLLVRRRQMKLAVEQRVTFCRVRLFRTRQNLTDDLGRGRRGIRAH